MNLHRILKTVKYQDKFDYHESQEHEQLEKKERKLDNFLGNLVMITLLGSMVLIPILDVFCNMFSWFFFLPTVGAIALSFMDGLFLKKPKLKKKKVHEEFSNALVQYLSVEKNLLLTFQALEEIKELKENYDLPQLFFETKSLLSNIANGDEKKQKTLQTELTSILEPLFLYFLKNKNFVDQKKQHELAIEETRKAYYQNLALAETDELLFSTHPPLSVMHQSRS